MSIKDQLASMPPWERKYAEAVLKDTEPLYKKILSETGNLTADRKIIAQAIVHALRSAWCAGLEFEQEGQQNFLKEMVDGANKP